MHPVKAALLQQPGVDRAISLLKHPRLLSSNFDYRNTLYLGGAGRSGTTWCAEVLNFGKRYRDITEPFDAAHVALAKPFFWGLYLRPADANPTYLEPARIILSGRVGNRRADIGNLRWFRRRRIIKEIRGNLWMKWLRDRFPGMPMIWLLRHPCAVVSSRIDLEWPTLVPQYLAQRELMQDHLEPLRVHIENARSPFEKHMFGWCIQHHVPLRQLARGDVHVMFYENLCVDPARELQRVAAFTGRRLGEKALAAVKAPSRSNFRGTEVATKSGEQIVAGWKRRLGPEQVRRAMEILDLFGLTAIYDDGLLPKVENLDAFFRREVPQARSYASSAAEHRPGVLPS